MKEITKKYRFSELPYVPTDYDAVGAKLQEYTVLVQAAKSAEEVEKIDAACDAMLDEVCFANTVAYIRSSLDSTDTFYAGAAQKEAMGLASLEQAPYIQELLDSPFLPVLEERFGPEYRPRLEQQVKLRSAGLELLGKEQVLLNQ